MATFTPCLTIDSAAKRLGTFGVITHNFAWMLAGSAFYAACQWGILVALARLTSSIVVGRFAYGLSVSTPVLMLTNLQLRAVLGTDVRHQFDFRDYLALRLLSILVALAVIIGIACLGPVDHDTAVLTVILGVAKSFEAIGDVVHGLMQQRERMEYIAASLMLKGLLGLGAVVVGLKLIAGELGGVIGLAIGLGVVALTYDLRIASRILGLPAMPRWNWGAILLLLRRSAAPGVTMMLISINTNIPRYVIAHELGLKTLGIFAALSYIPIAATVVVNALGQAVMPRLAHFYTDRSQRSFYGLIARSCAVLSVAGVAGTLVAALGGRVLLEFLYGHEYASSADAFVILMLGSGVGYLASLLGYGMSAARRFNIQVPLFAIVSLVTAGTSLLLVPKYAIRGAALATLASYSVQASLSLGVIVMTVGMMQSRGERETIS